MYAWIWRQLPFGLPGKLAGSLLLFSGAVSLLWFWVFPATAVWVENILLPFDQSTIEGPAPGGEFDDGQHPGVGENTVEQGEEALPEDPHAVPYLEEDGD
jgi:hypothetical protein